MKYVTKKNENQAHIFQKSWIIVNDVALLLSVIYCVGWSGAAAQGYKKILTLCTLYEQHKCSMCTQSKAAKQVPTITFSTGINTLVADEEW